MVEIDYRNKPWRIGNYDRIHGEFNLVSFSHSGLSGRKKKIHNAFYSCQSRVSARIPDCYVERSELVMEKSVKMKEKIDVNGVE